MPLGQLPPPGYVSADPDRIPTISDVRRMVAAGGGGQASSGVGNVYRLRQSVGQVIPHNDSTPLTWATQDLDVGAFDSGNPTRWVCPVSGHYLVTYSIKYTVANGAVMLADFFYTTTALGVGVLNLSTPGNTSVPPIHQWSRVWDLATGDYFAPEAYQNSGSSKTTDIAHTYIEGTRIR